MDITRFVISGRDQAFLYGDHSTYQRQLCKKLLNYRRKLNIATKNRGKFQKKDKATAEQISENHDHLYLLLLTSERAWAQAMSMKTSHTTDTQGITGKTRSHIVSRLDKAAKSAEYVVELLSESKSAGASPSDVLEARAYAALIRGSEQFEKRSWEACIRSYSVAHVIYTALGTSFKGDMYKDLLSETIDPSIRFAAYRLKTERTVPITVIARNAFPRSDDSLVQEINKLNPNILTADAAGEDQTGGESAPKTLTWRSREVRIEDAAISLAWGSIQPAKTQLLEKLDSPRAEPKDIAQAYDEILTASQDAVDATKQAVDELRGEGVSQSDPRMQSLQITWTAVNYEMISWRIGRNRVLTGEHDGALEDFHTPTKRKAKKSDKPSKRKEKEETPARRIAKLKEKVALYDSTLQSLESVRVLPGIPADTTLSLLLDATTKYFQALKALSIARSHGIAGNDVNALALVKYAADRSEDALPVLIKGSTPAPGSPRSMQVTAEDAKFLNKLLTGELHRHHAIVHIGNLRKELAEKAEGNPSIPLIDSLSHYPEQGVDLKNLVNWPPQLSLIPVKPIFLDVAWNYIDYPKESKSGALKSKESEDSQVKAVPVQKRGWFGFGR